MVYNIVYILIYNIDSPYNCDSAVRMLGRMKAKEGKVNFTLNIQEEILKIIEWNDAWNFVSDDTHFIKVLQALYHCLHIRDPLTAAHSVHMAHYSYRLAEHFDKKNAPLYFAGSLTHDIGKIGMTDHVLKGKHKLTTEERALLRMHVSDGFFILRDLDMPSIMLDIVKYHHERYDGSGYLEGLEGKNIPIAGRITAITDTFSALTTFRPYSAAISPEQAVQIMKNDSKRFDPIILKCFVDNVAFTDESSTIGKNIIYKYR